MRLGMGRRGMTGNISMGRGLFIPRIRRRRGMERRLNRSLQNIKIIIIKYNYKILIKKIISTLHNLLTLIKINVYGKSNLFYGKILDLLKIIPPT
jgi:hypothetical protein